MVRSIPLGMKKFATNIENKEIQYPVRQPINKTVRYVFALSFAPNSSIKKNKNVKKLIMYGMRIDSSFTNALNQLLIGGIRHMDIIKNVIPRA